MVLPLSVCWCRCSFPPFQYFGLATLITAAIALGTLGINADAKEIFADNDELFDNNDDTLTDLVKNTRAVTTFIIVLFVVTVASQISALVMMCFVACNKLRPRLLPLLIVVSYMYVFLPAGCVQHGRLVTLISCVFVCASVQLYCACVISRCFLGHRKAGTGHR